ncbi:MAG: hypothetical protein JWR83_1862 [Aeromicrobium sp.]|nr:hypothetical protein [Aeromicrobium sp.]
MPKPDTVLWINDPSSHDYPAAGAYLSLLTDSQETTEIVAALESAETTHQKAKDILRASRLPLLGENNVHVAVELKKIKKGKPLSPILLVRGDLREGVPLQIADGYHRVCASYHVNEDTDIPCRLVDLD